MSEDATLEQVKKELEIICTRFHLRMPNFNDLFKSVLSRNEIGVSNFIATGDFSKIFKKYEDSDDIDKAIKWSIARIEAGKIIGSAYNSSEDVKELRYKIEELLDTGNDSKDALYARSNPKIRAYLLIILQKIQKNNLQDSIPYYTPGGLLEKSGWTQKSTIVLMVHEGIHAILFRNGIGFRINALDEGLCVYIHREHMGWLRSFLTSSGKYLRQYARWAKYLKKYFESINVEPEDVPRHIWQQMNKYGRKKYGYLLVHRMRQGMGKDFESELDYTDYNK